MKIAKTIFNIAALVIVFSLWIPFKGNAQTVTYTAKNTATATGNVGTVTLTDISNNGTTVIRDNLDQTPVNFPMIGVSKTAATPVLQADGTYRITYTIKVQNYGATSLERVQAIEDFGSNPFTKVGNPSYNAVSVTTFTPNTLGFNGKTITNLLQSTLPGRNTVAPGGSITITLTVSVPAGTFGTYNNSVTATGIDPDGNTVTDISTNNASPNHANGTKTPLDFDDPTPVTLLAPDIKITKTVDKLTPKVGENVTFTVTAANIGAADAAPVTVTDLLPAGFTFVSATPGVGTYNSTTGVWSVGTIAASGQQTLTIVATVLPNKTTAEYTNIATNTQPGDADPTNNSATVVVAPIPQADLQVTNTDGKTTYTPGTSNTYTVVVTNNGPSDASGSTITYPFPTGVTGTWAATYAGGATGTASGTGAIIETANIPSGGTITYTITANVASNVTAAPLATTATVAVASGIVDPTPGNNTATDNDTFAPQADLAVTNTDGTPTYAPGTTSTYTVVASNNGPSDAPGSTVTYPFPTGVTGSWTATYAGGATGTASGTGAISETANIPSGGSITYTITANVASNVTANPLSTTATVAVPTGYVDPTPANNSATDNDTFPMIGLAKTLTSNTLSNNGSYQLIYTFKVQNYGAIDLKNIQVADDLTAAFPSPMTFTKVSLVSSGVTAGSALAVNAGFDGNTNKNLLNVASSNLKVGASGTLTLTINVVLNSTYGTFNNTATATGVTNDAAAVTVTDVSDNNASPNEGDATKTPLDFNTPTPETFAPPDIQVIKTVDNPTANVGSNVTFTILVKNIGAGGGAPLVFNDLLPPGFAYVSSTHSVPTAYNSTTGNWPIGIVTAGVTRTLTITTKVLPNHTVADYTNTATATAPDDTDLSNNTSSATVTPIPQADLTITNTDGKTTYTPGTSNTYTVVATNNGPSDAPGSTISYPFPTGVTGTWTAVYAGGATGTASGTGAISETANIPSGGTITYTITANVASNVTANPLSTTATVAVPTGFTDPTPANNTAIDNDTFAPQADLSVTNTDGKTSYTPGTSNTYTVTVTNGGPSDAPGSTVTYPFPTGVTGTWTATYAGDATGTASGTGAISETANIPSGGSITYTITANVASNVTANPLSTTATVAVPTGYVDPTPANNTATDNDTFAPQADLSVTNTDGKTSYTPGTSNTYTVTVTNGGPSDAPGSTVAYPFPTGVTGTWTATYAGGATGTASGTGAISETANIPSGGSITYTITANVASNVTANPLSTTATVAVPTGYVDPTPANNSATDNDTFAPQADLSVTNTDGKTTYIPGTTNTYTIVVNNAGPTDAPGSTITNILPAGVTGIWTAVYAGGATGGSASGINSIAETVNIPTGGTITYTYIVTIPSNVTGSFTNTATVAVPTGYTDPTPANNTAADVDAINPVVDLAITNTDGIPTYTPGTTTTYTIVASNNGPSDAPGSTVTNPLPAGTTGTWTAVYTGGATGNASGTGGINETTDIPKGATVTYTVVVTVPSSATGNLVSTAIIAVPTGYTDPTPANNTATDTDTRNPIADLAITNTDGTPTYTPGTTTTYTIVASNNGPSDASGSTVTNPLPAGTTGTWTAVYTGGATGNASGTGGINETVDIPKNGTVTYTVVVTVPGSATGNLVSTAIVAVPTGYTDPTPANNSATDTDTRNPIADLSITNTDGKTTYTPGTTNTYTVVVTNGGPTDVPGAQVTNTLPAGVTGTWTAVYTGGATGNANGTNSITETVNMPKGSTITYTYVVTIPSNITGSFTNTASVALPSGFTDPTPANNTAIDVDAISAIADLSITNTDSKTTYTPGTTNTYTVVVTNGGPTDVPGAQVTNTLPAGVTGTWTAVYAGGASGAASGTNSVNEAVNMPAGSTITYTYVITIPSNVTGNFTNTATVALPTGLGFTDPTPANNTATDVDTFTPVADLSITNTDGTPTYTPGTTTTYTIVASNNGPSDAPGSTVTNPLPIGTTGTWTAVYVGGATGNASGTGGINENVNIPSGGTITYTVTVIVPSSATGSMTSTATIAVPAGYTDPTPANNTATDLDTQNSVADMSVTKTSNNLAPLVGDNVTFTITALNGGPSDASGVNVTDLLKAGYSFVSATATKGSYVNGTGIWTIGSMVNGSSAVLTVIAKVTADIPTPGYDNAAVVSATETDPNLVNNTSTVTTVPVSLTDLAITQTVSSTIPDATGNVTFTLTVNNNGPSNATGVNVADLLKPGFTFVSANPAQGTYDPTTGIWAIGNLANGGTTSMTLTVKVNNTGTQVTDYTNTAVVSATQQEVTLVNNTSVQTVSKPPTATNDSGNTTVNMPVTINVISNDSKGSANLVPGSITIIQPPAHGTVTIDPTGKVIYTPATNYFGPDVFTYTVKDANGATSNVATVTIDIADNPKIGLAKSLVSVVKAVNGSFNVTYLLTVKSLSLTDLNNISITDDLSQTFRGENIKVGSIKSLGKLQVNNGYDGSSVTEMLQPGNILSPGETEQLQVVVNVALLTSGNTTYLNTANASGISVTGLKATDQSTDGTKPDPVSTGDVSSSVPTPVQLTKPKEFIPGGFSPNNDGVNDKFVIENTGNRHIALEVYNRWGNLVYKTADYKNDWDGRVTQGVHVGDYVPDGTYFYIAIFDGKDKYQGFITIHR